MGEPIIRGPIEGQGAPPPRLVNLGELLGELRADAAEAHAAMTEGKPRGPVTGLSTLDKTLGGRMAPGLTVLHGGPGIGKTAFALQTAASCGFPALYVSCEMSALELLRRIIARVTCTSLDWIRAGSLSVDAMMEKAAIAIEACGNLSILDATLTYASMKALSAAALKVKGESRHLLVVMDSIHSWADSFPGEAEEYASLNAALAGLRTLGRQLDCPVLGIAERNRASMQKGGQSASAGSRKFEYGGEAVIELDRDPDSVKGGSGEATVFLRLSKNRNGGMGQPLPLLWHDAYQRFREVPKP